eukprot:XP_011435851.1 PREDICTED: uncharacterized protein LOC105334186 [Crassostrea gigas]
MGVPKLMFVFLVLCYIDKSLERNTGKHTGLDHKKLSGRWYLFMDNRSSTVRDNTFGDFEVESDGKLLNTLYRYFPDLQECRTTSLMFQPIRSDSSPEMAVEFEVIRRSTNDVLGTQKMLYIDDDSANGFVIMHQESNLMDTYLVVTRSKNPSDQRPAIDAALIDLNLNPEIFYEKSANYGCETMTEQGFVF